jgi:uncharacterized protein YgiM (DUF1202 family)
MSARLSMLRCLGVVCVALASSVNPAPAQSTTRVVAAGDSMTLRRCGQRSCAVVAELPRGHAVDIVKTEGNWHQVLVTLEGRRITTAWVERTTVAPAPTSSASITPATGAPGGGAATARPAPLGEGAFIRSPDQSTVERAGPSASTHLASLATRTATADEWSQALALTSGMKASTPPAPPAVAPAPEPSRLDTVRRDGRTTVERMRDDLEAQFGPELKRLGETAATIDPDLQNYMATCYDKYLPVPSVVPPDGPTVGSRPPRVRATLFDIWRGQPVFGWNERWSGPPLMSAESSDLCHGLWNQVSERAADVKARVEEIEKAARFADIYPGVVRDALEAHGLSEKR